MGEGEEGEVVGELKRVKDQVIMRSLLSNFVE